MKKTVFLVLFCCFATISFSQINMGTTFGMSFYRWDKNPTTNSPELKASSGGFPNIMGGLHLMMGSQSYRLIMEGYGSYAPFSFDLNQFKGMGTFSYGGLAKISITPWTSDMTMSFTTSRGTYTRTRTQNRSMGGFSIGFGWEKTKTELYFTPNKYKTMMRDWYTIPYGYLAWSSFGVGSQMDFFIKYGIGIEAARNFEFGIKANINNIF